MMPRTNRHTSVPSCAAALAAGLLSTLALGGCNPFSDDASCGGDCGASFRCDRNDGVCRAKTLDDFDEDPAGHGLRAERVGDMIYATAVEPDSGLVTVGQPGDGRATRVIGRIDTSVTGTSAVAGVEDAGLVAVAWLTADRTFRLSRRTDERWHVPSTVRADASYRGTKHFDLAVGPEGTIHLAFHSGRGAGLRLFSRGPDDSEWRAETVDDGTVLPGRSDCAGTRESANADGVGLDPDVAVPPSKPFQPVASYYDERCGDLRVAERTEDGWAIRVVDNGNFSVQNDPTRRTGDVGRFSSLAVRSNGRLAVAYQDVGRGRLLFASESNGNFGTGLVDPGLQLDRFSRERKQLVGAFADLAIGADGTPYIAYLNGTNVRLQFAYRARNNQGRVRWYHTLLGASTPTGMYANVAIQGEELLLMAEQLRPTEDGFDSTVFRTRRNQP